MSIVDELIAVLGYKIEGEDQAKRFEKRIDGLNKGLNQFAKTAAVTIGAAAGAFTSSMGLMARSVVETTAQFEGYQATLETIEGTSEKAAKSLDWIAEFGKTTPYDVAQVTEAFVALKAYGIDPIANDALRTLGDTASAMGKPLTQAVEAFADAATGEFERLKEFGIKSASQGDKVTFSWTKNGQELTKTVKKNSTEIRAFLLETMGDRFSGAMDRQSKTWNGMMSNLGDTWTDFKRRVGEAGFFDSIKGNLQKLLDFLGRLDADGSLDRWADNISKTLMKLSEIFGVIGERIARNVGFLIDNFDSLQGPLKAIAWFLGLVIAAAFPLTTIFIGLGVALDDFFAYLQGGESFIGDFISWLQEFIGVSESAAEKITALVGVTGGLVLLAGPVRVLGAAFRLLASGIAATTAAAGVKGLGAVGGVIARLVGGAAAVLGASAIMGGGAKIEELNTSDPLGRPEGTPKGLYDLLNPSSTPKRPGMDEDLNASVTNLLKQNQKILDTSGAAAIDAFLNDNRQDNRQSTQTNNVTVNQTVTGAMDAAKRAATATGNAVVGAIPSQRTQSEMEPSF